LQEQDADANFPFYFTEAESQEEGQAWWLGVKGLDYEESRYYNFRIVLEVNSLCRAQDNFMYFNPLSDGLLKGYSLSVFCPSIQNY
jgi:hypothetical protein